MVSSSEMPARRGATALAMMAVLAGMLASSCTEKLSDEEQIRRVLDEGVAHLEKGDSAAAADLLSDSYLDTNKRTKKTMKRIAFFVLQRGPIRAVLRDVKIDVKGQNATATFTAVAVQGNAKIESLSDVVPTGGRQLEMTVSFYKEDGTWRVMGMEGDGMRVPT